MESPDRDPVVFLVAIPILFVLFGALVAGIVNLRVRLRQQREVEAKSDDVARRQREREIADAVKAGTHLPGGGLRCQASALCFAPATEHSPKIERDERAFDFWRRVFGAPPRYRVTKDTEKPLRYCEPHYHLADQEVRSELSEVEHRRQLALRDTEASLAHFERVGLPARLAKLVESAEKRKGAKRADNVIPISRSGTMS